MKSMIAVLVLLTLPAWAGPIKVKMNIAELHRKMLVEIRKAAPTAALKKAIVGKWYSTWHQEQIFPGGCDEKKGYKDKVADIQLSLYSPAEVEWEIRKVAGDLVLWDEEMKEGDTLEYYGNTFVTAGHKEHTKNPPMVHCTVLSFKERANVLVCWEPENNFGSECGWYGFYIR